MGDSTDPTDRLLRRAADRLTGHPKRLLQAEVAVALCGGSARRAERRFGWGRDRPTNWHPPRRTIRSATVPAG